jgi:hypothetical protein
MPLDLIPDIETAIRRRAQRDGLSVEELLARAFPPSEEGAEPRPMAIFGRRRQNAVAEWDTEDTWRSLEGADTERHLWRAFELEHR